MIVFGAAWQKGGVPLSRGAIRDAIRLNGASVEANLVAFELGRWAAVDPSGVSTASGAAGKPLSLQDKIEVRAKHLEAYQSMSLARRYRDTVARFTDPDMQAAVAEGYHKALAYKDEYEVARLLAGSRKQAEAEFEGELKMTYHLAPPMLTRTGPDGRPAKRAFGQWLEKALPLLAGMKRLRGTVFDPFGRSAERLMERELIARYEADIAEFPVHESRPAAIALARLPLEIRGFGPVKQTNTARAEAKRDELLSALRNQPLQSAAE
jgi:indolepyruvate ferredoxin oxidoreductase